MASLGNDLQSSVVPLARAALLVIIVVSVPHRLDHVCRVLSNPFRGGLVLPLPSCFHNAGILSCGSSDPRDDGLGARSTGYLACTALTSACVPDVVVKTRVTSYSGDFRSTFTLSAIHRGVKDGMENIR